MSRFLLPLLLAAAVAVATPADAHAGARSGVVGQVPGRILVTFKPGIELAVTKTAGLPQVGVASLDALARRYAVRSLKPLFGGLTRKLAPAGRDQLDRVWAVDFDPGLDPRDVQAAYAGLPEVARAQLVDVCRVSDAFLPDDPNFTSQWHLRNPTLGGADLRALGAWSESLGDSNIVICILDTGVDWHHPDLGGPHPDKVNGAVLTNWPEYYGTAGVDDDDNGRIDDIRGWDFVDLAPGSGWPDEDVQAEDNDPMDYGGHGTGCAGVAAAITNNGTGIAGVAPGCRILPVRCGWTPDASSQGLVRMDFAAQGMVYAVGRGADIINCSWESTGDLAGAVAVAQAAGVLIVTAAGNDDSRTASYLSNAPGVISVAATDGNDQKAGFSNYGSWVEISAPGVAIYTTTYQASTGLHGYGSVQGTSFSAPLVCGAAALLWSAAPQLTAGQIAGWLYDSADNIDAANPAHVGDLGAGRVNLLRALGDNVQRYPQEFPTLYDALNSAAAGDTIAVLGSAVLTGPVTVPAKALKLRGGYAADYATRDPVGNPTRINGPVDNHVLRFTGAVENDTEVDGFRISGGGGRVFGGIPYAAKYAGGVMLNHVSPTLRNLEITGNLVGDDTNLGCGGGLVLNGSHAVLENVHVHDNTAVYGAGIFAYQSTATLIDCLIEGNQAIATNLTYGPVGGGLHVLDSDLTLVDCVIRDHLNLADGGGIYAATVTSGSHLALSGCEISGNSARDHGGGLYIEGGSLTADRVLIESNSLTAGSTFMYGGGLYASGATVSLDSLTCTGNAGMVGGGLALVSNGIASITNSVLAENSAQFWGGGLVYDNNGSGVISGNTVALNDSGGGGAGLFLTNAAPAVTNNIMAFNTGGSTYANGMALISAPEQLACNDVYGNENADYSGQTDPTGTAGNIALDPLFCDATAGGLGVTLDSPCAPTAGACGLIGARAAGCGASATDDAEQDVPPAFRVQQNFPNPFNPRTTIRFALSTAGRTRVNIFDVSGRHVRTLLDEQLSASTHQVFWSGTDDAGRDVSAGIYFYMVASGANHSVGRMALVR